MNILSATLYRKAKLEKRKKTRLCKEERCKIIAMFAVVANDQQMEDIDALWFRLGNNGSKHSDEDHYFLQRLVEGRNRQAIEGPTPSDECIEACERILIRS